MAMRKYLVKLNHKEAVYKIVNPDNLSASLTISLATDLLKSNEDIVGTPKVAIRTMEWSVEDAVGAILISRNGQVTQRLHSSTSITQSLGADHEFDTSDISVAMTGGTLIIHLLKTEGYVPKFRPEEVGGLE